MKECKVNNEKKICFCPSCRAETEYVLVPVKRTRRVKEKTYFYETFEARCKNCSEELHVPGVIDAEVEAFDHAFRKAENLITKKDIKKLMTLYNIGKAPLSYALGFGEITISRYLDGHIPSKEYSDIMKAALTNPDKMEQLLEDNRDRVGNTAYEKAIKKVKELQKSITGITPKMICVIGYIFNKAEEVTPLALQKLLYFAQCICMVILGKELFPDDCEAWAHGPVYRRVYELFKEFKYNPIDDDRFVFFSLANDCLSDEEKKVLDTTIGSFGMYSGKVLEQITHKEKPWLVAREGHEPGERSHEIISKKDMQDYFTSISKYFSDEEMKAVMDRYFKLNNVNSVQRYIKEQL